MTATSATGAEPRRHRRSGFTLVELLIVLTILSLAAAAVAISLPERRPTLIQEAERLGARLREARDEAILVNRAVALRVAPEGYSFAVRRGFAWDALQAGPFAATPWEDGTAPRLADGALAIAFDATGIAEPGEIVLMRAGEEARIRVDAAGEIAVDAGPRR